MDYNNAGTMGNMIVHTWREHSRSYKIKITTPAGDYLTNAFTVTVACGAASTTIVAPSDLQTTQEWEIHTGNYYNAPQFVTGYKPQMYFSQFTVTRSECPLQTWALQNTQSDSASPTLVYWENSGTMAATNYVKTIDSYNFTEYSHTFTLKLAAKGGRTLYTDFTFNVVYNCKWDNITVVRSIPSSNGASQDMRMVGNFPVVYVNGTAGLVDYYVVDLRTIFTNNASYYCPRTNYEIVTVYNSSSGDVYFSDAWSDRMLIHNSVGLWEFINARSAYMNI